MARYGMVMDLTVCLGCDACVAACSMENETPFWNEKYRTHVERWVEGHFPQVKEVFLPRLCMHCENPPCVEVCPTGASYIDDDGGFVLVDENLCIGCGFCVEACPYDARYLYEKDDLDEGRKLFGSALPHHVVAVDKCTFCVDRVHEGREPACVETCVGHSRIFGDLDDPNSEVAKLVNSGVAKPLKPELGTKPKVFYVTKHVDERSLEALPADDYSAQVSRAWQDYEQPAGSIILGAAAVGLAALYPYAKKGAEEHAKEIAEELKKEEAASAEGKKEA